MLQQMLRNPLRSAPRRMFGVFVICWLNMAIAPCAMALQGEQECPHAPQALEQMAGHHGHHDVGPAHDCVTAQGDCCDFAIASVDTRGGKLNVNADDLAVVVVELPWHACQTSPAHYVAVHLPDPLGFSPPLHKLYCVYLD